ncbi:ABC transporter substrate-binding protein [Lapidilactobacillus salsurivasis]
MKKWQKAMLGVASVASLALLMAGCGNKKSSTGDTKDGVTTLTVYQVGDKPKNYDQLMAKANKVFEKEINAKLKFNYIGWGDFSQKMTVMVSSGDDYDIARADNYAINAQKGAYTDLTKLLPKYASKAYKDLDDAYIKGNTIDGKLYAMPVQGNVYANANIAFNKHFLEKYNLDIKDVKTYQDLEPLLKAVHAGEKSTVAFAMGKGFHVESNFDYVSGNGLPFAVDLEGDGTKIVNQYDSPRMLKNLKTIHDYYQKGYIAQDAASASRDYPMEGNTWFARQETVGPYDYGNQALNNSAGGDKIEVAAITDDFKTTSQAQMSNWVVGNNSKHKELAVKALGLLNSNPEILNGLVWGIKGENWTKTGDTTIKLTKNFDNSKRMPAWNLGNNKILYTTSDTTEEMIKDRDESIASAKQSPILGFNFDSSSVKTELSNIQNVMDKYSDSLNTGTVEPASTIKKMDAELKTAGYEKVQKEMQKQFDAWRK